MDVIICLPEGSDLCCYRTSWPTLVLHGMVTLFTCWNIRWHTLLWVSLSVHHQDPTGSLSLLVDENACYLLNLHAE